MARSRDDKGAGEADRSGKPKYHHYVPRLLLRAFARPANDDGRIWTFDKRRMSSWAGTTRRTGGATHHNTVDDKTHPNPLVWEGVLGQIESSAAPVVQAMRESDTVPTSRELESVLALVAAMHVGTPRARRRIEGIHFEQIEKQILAHTASKAARRRFRQLRQRLAAGAQAQGIGSSEEWERFMAQSPEEYLESLKSGNYDITTDESWKIALSVKSLPPVAAGLGERLWDLVSVPADAPELIIGDCPVSFLGERDDVPQLAGLRHPRSLVCVPIGPRSALLGWEQRPARSFRTARDLVLRLNCSQLSSALAQCYGSEPDFEIHRPDGGPAKWSEMVAQNNVYAGLEDWHCDKADEFGGR